MEDAATSRQRLVPCYQGMVAMLITSDRHRGSLRRLLEAGGASSCAELREGASGPSQRRYTHAFVDVGVFGSDAEGDAEWGGRGERKRAARRVHKLLESGASCLREDYVLDRLIKGPDLAADDYTLAPPWPSVDEGGSRRGVAGPEGLFDPEPIRPKRRPAE